MAIASQSAAKHYRGWSHHMRDQALVQRIMKSIRSEGGKADKALGSALWRRGLRFRRRSDLAGKPDLVFAGPRVVVFIDGDFWHGRYLDHRIARGDFKRNADYWIPKLKRTVERDKAVTEQLTASGWFVIRAWESEVLRDVESVANEISSLIREHRESPAEPRPARSKRTLSANLYALASEH